MEQRAALDAAGVRRLLADQAGVVARHQLVALGFTDDDLRRQLRRRALVPLHPGVYVNHTGPPTRLQQEWAAVLLRWPAALQRVDALRALGLSRDRQTIPLRTTRIYERSDARPLRSRGG